ncbi:hypothetical protein KC343_g3261 [Hortaea werneckii]|uniref:Uncharacterized protein n=1 Tax=Hortaea werneckii TaxID=91943 RepID=A0A3M7GJM0_HORWE|nr:hypothetical protein KC352_g4768 [Hortaea werneckii]KAI7572215.1 hypothetical protein KC317_g956 [Hortaea werneckii]KAI7627200.1 hypothetical protein KC346_g867 [Hortaea werneckii]KAI7632833.1 hypothetical protein KC343_g3261 [Hortaea werneckii]KAI7682696.1 hypothetical protein KC319_g865 [Hortaea werneckii]
MPAQQPLTLSQILTLKSSAVRLTDLAKAYNQDMSRRASNSDESDNGLFVGSDEGSEYEGDAAISNPPASTAPVSTAPVSNVPVSTAPVSNAPSNVPANDGGQESPLSSGSSTDDYVSAPTGPQFFDAEREAILYLRLKYGERLPPGIKWKITRRLNKWLRQVAQANGVEAWQRSFNSWRLEYGKMKDEIAKVERTNAYARSQGRPQDVQPLPFQRPSRMPRPGSFYRSREPTEEAESESASSEQKVDLYPEDPIEKIIESWPAIPTDPNQPFAFGLAMQEEDEAIAEHERVIRALEGAQPRPVGPTPQAALQVPSQAALQVQSQAARRARTVRFGGVQEREDSGREGEGESGEEEHDDGLLDPDDML